MKDIRAYARPAIALLVVAFSTGCARVKPQPLSKARDVPQFDARTLDDPGLRRFVEQSLGHRLQTWPLESWDFPKLTLAALYFHPSAATPHAQRRAQRDSKAEYPADSAHLRATAVAWQVRATLRTNLLAYVVAQRRLELLRQLESTQMELAQVVEKRPAADAIPPVELSLLRLQLAETRLELIQALQTKMVFRERLADSLALPVKALFEIEVMYDFSRIPRDGLEAHHLRRHALRNRSDVLLAVANYNAAETMLRREIAKKHPSARLNPGCSWDADHNQWSVNLNLDLPAKHANHSRSPFAKAEAGRIKAAAELLNLQTDIIGELDHRAAIYRVRLEDASDVGRLTAAIRKRHDAAEAQFKARDALRLELITARLQLLPAQLAQLEAQEKLQESLGALEDAVQLPADLIDPFMKVEPERPIRAPPVMTNPALIPKDAI